MSLFQRLAGIVGSFFQIGGPAGPGFQGASGGTRISAKNAAQSALVNVAAASPIQDTDVATKAYVDTIFKPIPVSLQTIAPSALIANTGTEQWYVVTTAGTGAAAAYTLGAILWDDGSSAGNVTILTPTAGDEIITTASLTGGAITFVSNSNYVWTGATWSLISPSVSGANLCIQQTLTTATTQTSTTSIPAGATVLSCSVVITTPFPGATITVGQTGSLSEFQAAGDNVATVNGQYLAGQNTVTGGAALPVVVTITGAPASGAGYVTTIYTSPLS